MRDLLPVAHVMFRSYTYYSAMFCKQIDWSCQNPKLHPKSISHFFDIAYHTALYIEVPQNLAL